MDENTKALVQRIAVLEEEIEALTELVATAAPRRLKAIDAVAFGFWSLLGVSLAFSALAILGLIVTFIFGVGLAGLLSSI